MSTPLSIAPSGDNEPDLRRLTECKSQSPRDRDMRDRLHQHRYLMFQHGVSIREIAEAEGVDERQIYLSITHCETRLLKSEVMANRNFRNAMVIQRKLAEKYIDVLDDLLEGRGGKNWHQRSKALEHFRRSIGSEAASGVNLQVTQQVGIVHQDQPRSFEEALNFVKRRHEADSAAAIVDAAQS
jgi:hypothetical protein